MRHLTGFLYKLTAAALLLVFTVGGHHQLAPHPVVQR